MDFYYFIGIDIAKDTLDWAVYTPQGAQLNTHTPNTLAGIKTALVELKTLPGWSSKQALFCMEHTGIYNAYLPGRIFMLMDEVESQVELALGVVLENAKFYRREDAVNTNLRKLLEAFYNRDHEAIKLFFEAIFEGASQLGGALPK